MIQFRGLEIASELLVRADDLRSGYLDEIRRFLTQLEEIAGRNRCECHLIDTRRPLADVLIDYLNQRNQTQGVNPAGQRHFP
jgi:hypothetical protein